MTLPRRGGIETGLLVDLRDIMKSFKHRKASKIYCPRCASPNIRLSSSLSYWLLPAKFVCKDCGYNGMIVMELEKEDGKSSVNPEARG